MHRNVSPLGNVRSPIRRRGPGPRRCISISPRTAISCWRHAGSRLERGTLPRRRARGTAHHRRHVRRRPGTHRKALPDLGAAPDRRRLGTCGRVERREVSRHVPPTSGPVRPLAHTRRRAHRCGFPHPENSDAQLSHHLPAGGLGRLIVPRRVEWEVTPVRADGTVEPIEVGASGSGASVLGLGGSAIIAYSRPVEELQSVPRSPAES